jgi:hypothetical protein
MNPSADLSSLAQKFTRRIDKLRAEALLDPSKVERYCIIGISQLNNFLRSYLLSLRGGAFDNNGSPVFLTRPFATEAELIDEIIKIGSPGKWSSGNIGFWIQKDEPAFHAPSVFLRVANRIGCSNIAIISVEMADSWKVDVLREVRNYFAHRCDSTERKAINCVSSRYAVNQRAARILLEHDINLAQKVLDDIHIYLVDFSKNIC